MKNFKNTMSFLSLGVLFFVVGCGLPLGEKKDTSDVFEKVTEGLDFVTALEHGDIDKTSQLISERSLNVNAEVETSGSKRGYMPLHYVVMNSDKEAQKTIDMIGFLILYRGANPNVKDKHFGNTPLHYAAKRPFTNAIQLLLSSGADKTLKNNDGQTAYDIAHKNLSEEDKESLNPNL